MKLPALLALLLPAVVLAGDWPQWGHDPSRNMVSDEKNLPATCDPGKVNDTTGAIDLSSAKNIKWVAKLGSHAYGNTTVAGGKVFIGTNNDSPRDPKFKGDYSMLYCLDEATGKFLWQLGCPKLSAGENIDTGDLGICSSPAVDVAAGRVYVVTNRCEILCLDINGQANGNDGPFTEEGQYFAGPEKPAMAVGPNDADIIWRYDMRDELGIFANQECASSVLLLGDKIYACTSNSRNWAGHAPAPNAPVLICLDKKTGKLLGQEASGISSRTFLANWSSPAYGKVGNQEMIIFGGGDGWCYGFAPEPVPGPDGTPILKELWRFDANPPQRRMRDGKPVKWGTDGGPREIVATPVFYDNKVYVALGRDPDGSAEAGCLSCIDPSKTGDITQSGKVWQYDKIKTTTSNASIVNDLLFIADHEGFVYCFDAQKGGKPFWKHDVEAKPWGSTLAADGKVYVGTSEGNLITFTASKEEKVLGTTAFGGSIVSTPVAANGTLYVASETFLYAISEKK